MMIVRVNEVKEGETVMERDAKKQEDDAADTTESGSAMPTSKEAYAIGAQAKTASVLADQTNNHSDHRRAMDLHKQAQTMHEQAALQSQIMDDTMRAKEHVSAANYHADLYNDHRLLVTPNYY